MPRHFDPNNPPAYYSSLSTGAEAPKGGSEKHETSQGQRKAQQTAAPVKKSTATKRSKRENHQNGYTLGNNEGRLFMALKSNQNPRQPNMRGTINIDGTLYDLSGWFHRMKNGNQQYVALRARKQHKDKTVLLSTLLNGEPYFVSKDKDIDE